jgi:hypothetical protein
MTKSIFESVIMMAEAHLINVQSEIKKLENQKVAIDKQIGDYKTYVDESIEAISIAKKELADEPINTPMPQDMINKSLSQAAINNTFIKE